MIYFLDTLIITINSLSISNDTVGSLCNRLVVSQELLFYKPETKLKLFLRISINAYNVPGKPATECFWVKFLTSEITNTAIWGYNTI